MLATDLSTELASIHNKWQIESLSIKKNFRIAFIEKGFL